MVACTVSNVLYFGFVRINDDISRNRKKKSETKLDFFLSVHSVFFYALLFDRYILNKFQNFLLLLLGTIVYVCMFIANYM